MKKYVLLACIISVVSLLMFGSEAFGRCRGRIFRGSCAVACAPVCTPIVHHKVVADVVAIKEVVVAYPVLVPAYQFQYVPPVVTALPVVPVAPYGAVGYGTAGYGQQPYQQYQQPQYQQQYQQPYQQQQQFQQPYNQAFGSDKDRLIKELAKAVIEEMKRQFEGGDEHPPVPQTSAPPVQQPDNRQPVSSQIPPALQYQALTALSRNCAACHTGVGSKKGLVVFSQPGYFNPNVNLRKIKEEIETGRMPPTDSQFHPTVGERNNILEWLRLKGV